MRKWISFAAGIVIAVLVLAGCRQNIEFARPEVAVNDDNQVAVAYHNKDMSQGFREFLKNPAASFRSALEDGTAPPEEIAFAQLWDSLTEEERWLMVENADSVEIRQDSYISAGGPSPSPTPAGGPRPTVTPPGILISTQSCCIHILMYTPINNI